MSLTKVVNEKKEVQQSCRDVAVNGSPVINNLSTLYA